MIAVHLNVMNLRIRGGDLPTPGRKARVMGEQEMVGVPATNGLTEVRGNGFQELRGRPRHCQTNMMIKDLNTKVRSARVQ